MTAPRRLGEGSSHLVRNHSFPFSPFSPDLVFLLLAPPGSRRLPPIPSLSVRKAFWLRERPVSSLVSVVFIRCHLQSQTEGNTSLADEAVKGKGKLRGVPTGARAPPGPPGKQIWVQVPNSTVLWRLRPYPHPRLLPAPHRAQAWPEGHRRNRMWGHQAVEKEAPPGRPSKGLLSGQTRQPCRSGPDRVTELVTDENHTPRPCHHPPLVLCKLLVWSTLRGKTR